MKEADLVLQTIVRDHAFAGPDFYCSQCAKPRACHADYGFVPNREPSRLSRDMKSSYRGHPYWFRPGTIRLKPEEQKQLDRSLALRGSRRMT